MTTSVLHRTSRVWLPLLLLSLAGACDREKVDQQVRQVEHAKDELATQAQQTAEQMKDGAARLKAKLPHAEQVQEAAREGLDQARSTLGDVRQKVSETLRKANDKVDETVEKAKNAGD